MSMRITFWGVRGSVPAPGPSTAEVGGNTACVEVSCGRQRFILDAGTGIRPLGRTLVERGELDATILLSHYHQDHLQGFPFFAPLHVPGSQLTVIGPRHPSKDLGDIIREQLCAPGSEESWEDISAVVATHQVRGGVTIHVGDVQIRTARLNHPGGGCAYRVDHRGRSVVYATDTEHFHRVDPLLERLAYRADVLIYDAHFTEAEYRGLRGPPREGWGHSTWEAGLELARAADVGSFVAFHHDPERSDREVRALEQWAQCHWRPTVAAREGLQLKLAAREEAA